MSEQIRGWYKMQRETHPEIRTHHRANNSLLQSFSFLIFFQSFARRITFASRTQRPSLHSNKLPALQLFQLQPFQLST